MRRRQGQSPAQHAQPVTFQGERRFCPPGEPEDGRPQGRQPVGAPRQRRLDPVEPDAATQRYVPLSCAR